MRTDMLSRRHPAVNLIFFAVVMLASMFSMHPAILIIMTFSAALYALSLDARNAARMILRLCIPVLLGWMLINPIINRQGATVLLYVNDTPFVTLESLIYGAVSGLRFVSVMLWFFCYNRVMTTDKFLCLFGRITPSLALLLSMALRFVSRYNVQSRRIADARRGIGRYIDTGGAKTRVRSGAGILLSLTTWAVENSMITADSMNSRGYGTLKRTRFVMYRVSIADAAVLAALAGTVSVTACGVLAGFLRADYFPVIDIYTAGAHGVTACVCAAAFALLPVIMNIWEAARWRYLLLRI